MTGGKLAWWCASWWLHRAQRKILWRQQSFEQMRKSLQMQ
jgi:hypothetical protein